MDNQNQFCLTSSPRSSDDNESHQGTPETKLTAFSPEDTRNGEKADKVSQTTNFEIPPTFSLASTGPSSLKSNLPEGYHDRPKSNSNKPAVFHLFGPQELKDPFIAGKGPQQLTGHIEHQKLSPTASAFTPLGMAATFRPSFADSAKAGISSPLSPLTPRMNGMEHGNQSGVSYLNATSVPEETAGDSHLKFLNSVASAPGAIPAPAARPIGSRPSSVSNSPAKVRGSFSMDHHVSRSLIIERIPRSILGTELGEFFDVHLFPSLKGLLLVELNSAGRVYLGFTDIRDAERAHQRAQSLRPNWSVKYIAPDHFAQKYQPGVASCVSAYEGQMLIKVHYTGPSQHFSHSMIESLIQELLDNYGEMKAFEILNSAEAPFVDFRAEFYDTKAADAAVNALNCFKVGGCSVSVVRHEPDLEKHTSFRTEPSQASARPRQKHELEETFSQMNLAPRPSRTNQYTDSFCNPNLVHLSPTGRSAVPLEEYSDKSSSMGGYHRYSFPSQKSFAYSNTFENRPPGAIGQERGQFCHPQYRTGPQSPQRRGQPRHGGRHDHGGHHNVVDIERIRRGLDVRTTIMLRNIPNKIDQAMLKEIVDESSAGRYDFMYLRIDFANNCNVGYAFINFEDPWFIIDFVKARAGLRWNRFNSDKVAEVSYATIQGKDCLVQKFRNSSVMLEHPSFRPKIFHTGTGPLAGTEDTFPGPDNPSKMRRSVENAEHVGLFAPRAGQHFRDEQRRRRSQYDRGTRLAELEEAYDYQVQRQIDDDYHGRSYNSGHYGRFAPRHDLPY
ncbi:MAG: hypothetical protein M1819_001317 [Sarea resinae]|nr:MAG: hypothetical protein M1819_001317 [Sarea resinae]